MGSAVCRPSGLFLNVKWASWRPGEPANRGLHLEVLNQSQCHFALMFVKPEPASTYEVLPNWVPHTKVFVSGTMWSRTRHASSPAGSAIALRRRRRAFAGL